MQEQWAGDSSGKAYGGIVNARSLKDVRPGESNGTPMMQIWSEEIQREHITLKELRVVEEMLRRYGAGIQNRVLRFLEDNMSVVAVLSNFTSRSPEMMKVLDRIINMLTRWDIELRMLYCDTESMPADWFSRDADKGDWQLCPRVASQYIHSWGTCTIDRFADFGNAQLPTGRGPSNNTAKRAESITPRASTTSPEPVGESAPFKRPNGPPWCGPHGRSGAPASFSRSGPLAAPAQRAASPRSRAGIGRG